MADAEDRTLPASERRKQRAREEGQVPLSREMVTASGLGAAVLVLALLAPATAHRLAMLLRDMLADLDAQPNRAMWRVAEALAVGAGPFLAAAVLAGPASVLLQTGFLLNTHALMPDLGRLNPQRGLKRLFGLDNTIEALKAVAKLAVLAWAVWSASSSLWPSIPGSLLWTTGTLADRIGQSLLHLAILVGAAQAGIALLDIGYTRWRFSQRLRMSREELKQETREADGDPKVKGRLKQIRQARARRRMMAAVAKATVVITNPTHYAVALSYERGGASAPRVIAKGVDELAARIRAAAEKAKVPLVANPPLARSLYTVPLDAEVPPYPALGGRRRPKALTPSIDRRKFSLCSCASASWNIWWLHP